MGDVGSTFLGVVFAGLVLQAPSWPEALGLLLVAGAVVNANAQLHSGVLLNSGAVVDHDAICASASGAPAALAVGWCLKPLPANGRRVACRGASRAEPGAARCLPRRPGLQPRERRWYACTIA